MPLDDLNYLIQQLMELRNRYGARPVVIEKREATGWLTGLAVAVDDPENEFGPITLDFLTSNEKGQKPI